MLKWSPVDKTSLARPCIGNLGKYIEQKEASQQAKQLDSGASRYSPQSQQWERHAQLTLQLQQGFSCWPVERNNNDWI